MIRHLRKLIVAFILLMPFMVKATHIVGGSLNYVYNGGSSYTITLKLYRDCSAGTASFPGTVNISVLGYNGQPFTPSRDITMSLGPVTPVPSNLPPCAQQPTPMPCTQQGIYTVTVNNLPPNPGGYHLYYQIVARNLSLTNVNASGNNVGESFYAYIPGSSVNWLENFTFANGTTVDNGSTAWSTNAGLPAVASASVNGNAFQITGADNGAQTWSSQVINIAGLGSVNANVNLSESGTLEATDSIMVYYSLNGGPLIPFTTNGIVVDDFGSAIASVSNLTGNTLQIFIKVHYSATSPNSEIYTFDNVTVSQNNFEANSNPVFTVYPPLFLCVNTPFTFDHSATDIDGDSLVYDFYTPYNGENNAGPLDPTFTNNTAVFTPITFLPGYSTTSPLGGAPLTLNPSTGLLSGTPPTLGQFVVGILVKEYRDGVLISSTLRDFQFNVVNCPQTLAVTIGPQNPTICFGGTSTNISANATGGTPPYSYLWNNANPAQNINVGVGTYSVTVTDAAGCQVFAFVTVNSFTSAITANAGPNINKCITSPTTAITGTITAASGGTWSGGTGTYNPNNTTLTNMQYTPSAAELSAGFANLILTTTGNGTCPAARDTVRINFAPFQGTVTPSSTPVNCFGQSNGSATVNVTGGNGPFTYLWNTSPTQSTQTISNLNIGTYSVTITDATGCTSQTNTTVAQPTLLSVSTSVTTGGCAAGNITTTVNGGTGPYTYSWLPGGQTTSSLNAVPAGTYTVNVTDSRGCTASATAINNQPLPISVSITGTATNCFGTSTGAATSTVSGGTSPYTYSWSGSGATSANVSNLAAGTYTLTVTDTRACTGTATVTINQPTAITATTNVTNETCSYSNNGTASVVAAGGTGPYTYNWLPGGQTSSSITNLSSATYTVNVTDSRGCITSSFATITEPPVLTASFGAQTNVSCFGGNNGTVTAAGTGGTPSYTYNWMPGNINNATANGLSIGIYTVTVTDSRACTGQNTVTITQPSSALAVNGTITNARCAGTNTGSILASASGGTGPYSYLWAPTGQTSANATSLSAGTYTINVTDNRGCTAAANFSVTEPSPITITLTPTNLSCFATPDGSISSNVSGGNPGYTYFWSPGASTASNISNLNVGTYTLTVRDVTNCVRTASVTLTRPTQVAGTITKTNETCEYSDDGTATVNPSGGTPPYTYSWAPTSQTTQTATGLASGIYTVTVTDANNCTRTINTTITQPNPNSINFINLVNVRCFGGSNGSVRGVPSGGTPGYTYSWAPGGQTSATITNQPAGIYTLTVTDSKGCVAQSTVEITQPSAPIGATINATPPTCFGTANASASAIPSGGTGTYTSFIWTPGNISGQNITNIGAGNYTVTIRDNLNCSGTATVNISQPSQIIPVLNPSGATCGNPNGSISSTVSGGTAPYNYQWFPTGGNGANATSISAGSYTLIVTDANGCTGSQSANVNNTSGPNATIFAVTNVSCFGGNDGSASVGVVGGTGTLVYQWLPSGGNGPVATGLTAGVYTVSVTDANGCQSLATTSPPITQPPQIEITITPSDVLCFGGNSGSAVGSASGGTGTLDYLWLPGNTTGTTVSGLSANTYTLQITDDNTCVQTQTYTISQPSAALSVNLTSIPTLCFGSSDGEANAIASGGTSPYNYNWTPGNNSSQNLGGIPAGTYTVDVSDNNGCTTSSSISVSEPALLTVTASSGNSTCGNANGTATTSVNGGTGTYTYFWIPGNQTTPIISASSAGSYTVLVNDANNCSATASVNINNTPGPSVSVASTTNVSCNGGSDATATSSVIGGTGTITYLWSPSGGNAAIGSGLGTGIYTVTVTDDNGCQAAAITSEIVEPNPLSVSVTTINVDCFGNASGSASANATGGTPGYTYTWQPGNLSGASVNNLTANTYTLEVRDLNNCIITQTVNISQPTAALNISISNTPVSCFGGNDGTASATVSGGTSPYTYLWTPTGGFNSSESNLSIGNYTLNVADANGCTSNATTTITQPSQSLSVSASGAAVSCFGGNNGSAIATVTGGTSGYTYNWLPSGGTNQTASGLIAGTYTVEVTDARGCESNATVNISEPTAITGNILVVNASCGFSNGTASAQIFGGTSPYQYAWSNGATNISSISALNPGNYSVTITDALNCVQNFNSTLINIPGPTVSSVGTNSVSCFGGNNGSATINISQGTAPFTIQWLPNGGNNVTATGLAAGTYTAVVTDSLGCVNNSVNVTINEPQDILVSISQVNDVLCNGGNTGSITVSPSGGIPNYSYLWTPGGNTSATINNVSAGNYSVLVTDQNSCTETIGVIVSEPTPLSSNVPNSTNPLCFGENGNAFVSVTGGSIPYTYSWNSNPIQTGNTADPLPAGSYTVNITDANGCTTQSSVTITQPNQLLTSAGPNQIVCLGNSTSLSANASGGTGGFQYTWAPLGIISNGPITITPTTTSIYTVTAYDQNGCAGISDTITATVYNLNASSIQAVADTLICPGASTGVFLQINGNPGPVSITWNNGLPPGPGAHVVTPFAPTSYVATVTNQCGAIVRDTVIVRFNPQPSISLIPDTNQICVPGELQFTDASITGNVNDPISSWLWNFGDGSFSNLQNPSHQYTTPGVYNVSLTVNTFGGCTNNNANSPVSISAFPYPTAAFNINSNSLSVPADQLVCTNQSIGANSYLWNFGDGLSSTAVNPQHLYNVVGNFTVELIATNQFGCSDTATRTLTTDADVVFPNAFSPSLSGGNGGAYNLNNTDNNVFFPYTAGVSEYKLQIFNRWGELIFETNDIGVGWDGYYRGVICPQDVYIYKAYIKLNNGKTFNKAGDVTLLQ